MHHTKPVVWLVFAVLASALSAVESGNEHSARLLRLEKFVVPEFPAYLRMSGTLDGTVAVAIGHDAQGRPNDILVVESSNPGFTEAALDAVKQWRFVTTPSAAGAVSGFIPLVRFLFTTRGISITAAPPASEAINARRALDANKPVSLPSFDELDSRPRAITKPMPVVASGIGKGATGGTVTVKYFVDAEGRARVPIVMEAATPELGAAATAAVAQWRFEPPKLGGKPVIVLETVSFRLARANDS